MNFRAKIRNWQFFLNFSDFLKIRIFFSGKKEERNYENGTLSGPAVIYGTDGDKFEFTYVEGIIEGTAVYFAASGASEERTYVSGIPHGPATLFLTNGDTEERTYENGNLHGIATFASHNGDREERCYVSGKLDGTAKYYYSSGAIGKKYSRGQILFFGRFYGDFLFLFDRNSNLRERHFARFGGEANARWRMRGTKLHRR